MQPRPLLVYLLAALASLAQACSSSSFKDAGGDAGTESTVDSGIEDGGDGGGGGGCATLGYTCDSETPCCDVIDQMCDPLQSVCVEVADGGDAGSPPPSDGAQWVEEPVSAGVAGLSSLSVPSPLVQVAVGTGPGLGQLLQRSDGGWTVFPGAPPAGALYAVWADPSGNVFAVGQVDGGLPLWLTGRLDGGLSALDLGGLSNSDSGPTFSSLDSVLGLGPGEALAVGTASFSTPATAVHLLPDGGLTVESFPFEYSKVYGLAGGADGGPIYALAMEASANQPPLVLRRVAGTWTELPQFVQLQTLATLSQLVVGPSGDLSVVGDDGSGNGIAFTFTDAGFVSVAVPRGVPPLTAACELPSGEFFIAASSPAVALELIHVDGGLANGMWWTETLPADAQSVSAIAGDGAGNFFAVGVGTCAGCPGSPLAMRRLP